MCVEMVVNERGRSCPSGIKMMETQREGGRFAPPPGRNSSEREGEGGPNAPSWCHGVQTVANVRGRREVCPSSRSKDSEQEGKEGLPLPGVKMVRT